MQLPPVDQDSVLSLLHLIPPHSVWVVLLVLTLAILLFNGLRQLSARRLGIRPLSLELARSTTAATEVLRAWGEHKRQAAVCIVASSLLFLTYVVAVMYFCFWAARSLLAPVKWLAVIGVILGWVVVAAALCNVVGTIAMLRTLKRGASDGWVTATRVLAWVKLGVFAVAAAFLVFRAEYFVYELIATEVAARPRTIIGVLVLITGFLGIRVLRITRNLHPPLLTLQMARSPEAANRILRRWKPHFTEVGKRANKAEMGFALAYAVTLGVIAFRIAPPEEELLLRFVARGAAWFLLLAGTLHLVQNLAANFAMGAKDLTDLRWWVGLGRRSGRLRLVLLAAGGTWLFMRFLWWEGETLGALASTIRGMIETS